MKGMAQAVNDIITRRERMPEYKDPAEDTVNLRALVAVLLRRKMLIAGLGFLGALVAALVALQAPTRYAATTTVMLNTRTLNVVNFESVLSNLTMRPETIENEIALIRSATILNRVIDTLDLTADPEFNAALRERSAVAALRAGIRQTVTGLIPEAVQALLRGEDAAAPDAAALALAERNGVLQALREALTITQVDFSVSIAIRVLSESPANATRIANAIAETYITDQLTSKAQATEEATRWLSERVAQQRTDLERAETALTRALGAASGVDAEALLQKNEQIQTLRDRLAREAELAAEAARNRDELDRLVSAGRPVEAARLGAAFSPGLRSALAQGSGPEALAPLLDAEIRRLGASALRSRETAATLERGIARLGAEIAEESQQQVRIQQLSSEVEALRLVYSALLSRLNETANQFSALQADARIVSPAFPPDTPAEPRRTLMVLLGGSFGLMLGAALAFLLEALNTQVRSARELEAATGLPVLTHVPVLDKPRRGRTIFDVIAESGGAHEGAQSLSTALTLRELAAPPQLVMVTSSHANEGKSTICLMHAQADAAVGKSVLILDADFRRPTMHKMFPDAFDNGADLLSLLDGRTTLEESIHVDEAHGISFLGVRRPIPYAMRLIASDAFRQLLVQLRTRYNTVLVDTPPVMLVSDALRIGALVDSTIYVVRWNSTPTEVAKLGLSKLDQHGVAVSGTVLTFVDFKRASGFDTMQYGSMAYDNPYFGT
jgi:capsular exopolysaccharide synthesis family protein